MISIYTTCVLVSLFTIYNERSSMAPRSVHFGMWSRMLSNVGQSWDEWPKIYYLELLRASDGTLSVGPRCICSR
jgi:hypothetical protein